jgi:hypothetical protein
MVNFDPKSILDGQWLEGYVDLYEDTPTPEITAGANQWADAVIRYADWLEAEGFTVSDVTRVLFGAVKRANFDLSRFPVCP